MITWLPWEEVDDLWSVLNCNEVLVADEESEGNRQEVGKCRQGMSKCTANENFVFRALLLEEMS